MKMTKKSFAVVLTVFVLILALAATSFAATPKLSKSSVTVKAGSSVTLKVTGYSKTVKWSSASKAIATVSSSGVVKGVKAGTTKITAKAGTKVLSCSVKVTPKLNKTSTTLVIGKTATLKVTGYSGTVKWSSSNKNIVSVTSKGVIKAVTTGTATITATCGADKVICKVTSIGVKIPSDAVDFKGSKYKVYKGELTYDDALKACEKLGGHLAVITSDEENQQVQQLASAVVRDAVWLGGSDAKTEGTWEWVTGEAFTYSNWNGNEPNNQGGIQNYLRMYTNGRWDDVAATADYSVDGYACEWNTVKTGINKTTASIYYGSTTTLKINYTAASVTWSSDDTSIATVSSKGVVTGKGLGTATITGKTAGRSFKCKITVKDRSFSVSPSFKCTTGGTFIKGVNKAKASVTPKSYPAAKITVAVVNAAGSTVYKKTFTKVAKGTTKSFEWDGKNSSGSYVSSGSYRLKVTIGTKNSYSGYVAFKTKNDFAGGDGSKSDPFRIASVAQFKKIMKYPTAYFKQTKSLDFDYEKTGGFFSEQQPFNGTYDGNNKSLSNITTDLPLFNCVGEKGVLKNMVIKNGVITASSQFAALLALYNYGKIEDCKIEANLAITGDSDRMDAAIVVCKNYGRVTGCEVTGAVSVTNTAYSSYAYALAAGIVADNYASGKIISCTADVTIKASSYGDNGAACIVGENQGSVVDCEATGTVESNMSGQIAWRSSGSIQMCTYTGTQQLNPVYDNSGVIV